MKKPTFSKFIIFASLFLMNFVSFAQNDKAFGVRFDKDVQGDMLLIGNNILSQDNNNYNNDGEYNSNIDMKYIDIDNDASTFSSSSANLTIPNKGCVKILYAGLYWSAILQGGDRSTINTVKFKSPTGGYNNITGQVIWDADAKPVGGNKPYVCYADVTNLMDLTNPNGKYTVANVVSSLGLNGGTGLSAGWSLYIVYEDLTLTSKSITSFDGFSGITKNTGTLDINISGFRTIPVGPVRAKIAFAALEGDKPITGDYLEINGSAMSTTERPVDNFFNSTVTDLNGLYIDRVPASSNTLGYDAGIMKVNNPATKKYPGGSVIKNDDQSATITLGSTGDTYFFYFTAFAVDIIAPKIVLTKVVQDNSGKDIGNTNVTLGDQLNYVIGFQNVGNDNAKSLTIRDVLPINIIFNYPADLMALPAGVTVKSYNAATREIIFNIDNSVVEVGDTALEIRFKVKVVPSCNMLSDACSNSIDNIAYATYKGTLNPDFVLTDDPSANTNTGCLLVKKATNFLVGIDDCKFTKNEILCGATVTLKAANGYNSYSWSSSPTGTPVLGTSQTLTVSKVGTYYVHDTAVAPCLSIDETVTVTSFGGIVNNPVIPFADQVVVCTSDGKKLPNIFLCGANASKLIKTNISDGSTIVWEKLNENGTCPAATSTTLCANESASCSWTQVATGPDYLANTSGQFRLTLTYPGGCFNRFYFNVFQNLLNPTATSTDIFCNTPATITVGGVGAGYEYSLDKITYQSSNVFPNPSFPVVTAGNHTVYIRQIGVANGCVFEVNNIQILNKVLKVSPTKVVQPLCFGYKGSIKVGVNDVKAQYTYTLYKNGTFVSSSGLTNALDYEFLNLDGGTTTPLAPIKYRIDVTTDNGCMDSVTVDLIMPDLLTASAALTKPFTCNDGEITVNAAGGTKPYYYFVNSSTVFQTVPQIVVSNPLPVGGVYNIDVTDDNGCPTVRTSITVNNIPMPVYTVAKTDVKCYGDNTGVIQFNVTAANGYTLMYSIDNGTTYSASNVFSNLVANTVYTPKIKYSLGGVDCFDTKPAITLTGPAAALTASAGVSELAGCGPGGAGKIRITNAQGGTPFPVPNPYLYSFDNQNSWSPINEAYLPVGTYTVYIKDANGCIFQMKDITIDPLPVAPVIDKVDVVYSCDGTAKSTVTVTKPASVNYDYTYSIDGVLNSPDPSSNVFVGVPAGNHIIKVGYVLKSATTFSNLLNEDFGRGAPTTTPGIASAYCFNDQHVLPPYFCPNPTRSVEDNQYSVTSFFWRSDDPSSTNVGAWYHFKDHTVFTPAVTDGRYLLVNIGSAAGNYGVLYSKPIVDVVPNQDVKVDLYLGNLLRNTMNAVNPDFIIELVDGTGKVVASQATGVIPNNELWNLKSLSLNPGPNTSLTFKIRSGSIAYGGNDAVIDDIRVYQLPKACIDYKDIPLVIASNKKFDATITGTSDISCAGLSDGTITINVVNFDPIAGFKYSKDGTTWLTSTTSPVKLINLGAGTYTPEVLYIGGDACSLKLTPTKIIAPAPIVVKTTQTVATCQVGATVDATTTTGGTPAYSFQLIDTMAPFTVINFPNTGILNNVPPGTYVVKATDAKGCTANKASNLVIVAPVNPTASIVQNTGLCFDPTSGANITVNVGGGVGPYTYKTIFNGGAASASSPTFAGPTFTYNATVTGTYSFEVYDSYGCKATTADQIINAKLTAAAAVTTALDCDVAPASPDAVIKVTITNGNAPYKYKVKKGLGAYGASTLVIGSAFNNQVTPANADTYTYEITDNLGCVTTAVVTVNPLVPVTGSVTKKDDPTCFNGTDGQVQLAGGGGSGVYQFSFNGSGFTSTSLYTALDAKTTTATTTVYSYQVKDSNGCVSPTYTVTLNNPTAVVASATIPVNNTCSTTTIITTAGAGGAGGYSYSFNGSSTYTNVNTLSVTLSAIAQTITYSVKDSKGCIDTKTINIPAYNPPTGINFSTPAVITCLATTTSVMLTPVAGVAPFTYLITVGPGTATSNVTGASSGTFTGLLPGNYTFQVTDANGCKASASLPIAPAAAIVVSGSKTDVKCFGASDGTATFTVTGASAVGNYTYTLSPASGSVNKTGNVVTVTGLGTGTYDLVVKDITTGCTSNTASVTINPATAITFTVASTKVNCNNKISTISFPTLSGGTPGYTYAFVTAGAAAPGAGAYSASTTVDTALLGLSIDVYVKDTNGCIAPKQTILIGQENVPTINTPATQCYVGTPIAITITGTTVGTPSYSIDNVTYGSSPNFNLGVGSYTLYIKDGFGCSASTPYVVAPQLTISAIAATDVTCTPNTTINLTATGGTGAYTYQVSNGGAYSASTNPYVTAIAGTYTFKVIDAATPACSVVSAPVIVKTKATVLTLTTTKTDVKCKGDATGTINITPTSGVAPYTYSVTKGGLPVSITATTTGLVAGTYDIVVTDALGCNSASTPVIIGEPVIALSASATAPPTTTCGTSTTVTVTGAGGTGVYTYSINGSAFSALNTLVINDNGTDQVISYQVRDANGCTTVSQNITVKALNPPKITGITGTPIYCLPVANTTSTVTVATSNGLAPLAFVIVSGPTVNTTGAINGKFTGLTSGTYLFKVTDANGCSDTKSYTVDPVTPIDIKGQNISNVLCNAGSTGIAKYTVSGFSATGNYTVTVTSAPAALPFTQTIATDVITLSNLAVGSYTVTVKDNTTGCSKSDVVAITQPPVLSLVLASNVNANCYVTTSKVSVTAGGGTPGYTYAFMQNNVVPVAADYGTLFTANLNPTTNLLWDVWVKDAKGCETKLDVTIAKDPMPTVTASVQNQCTATGSSFVIKAVGAGGVGAYTYTINTGVAPTGPLADTFTVAPGTYTITVQDANGCPNNTSVTVNAVLNASASLIKDLTCSPAPTEATIAINANGGKLGYSYKVSFNGGAFTAPIAPATIVGNVFTTSVAGVYKFEVTDSNLPTACTVVTNNVTVTTPVAVTASYAQVNPICNGFTDGSIKITALTGVAPFTYSITGAAGTFVSSNVFGGLVAGSYDFAVKDSKGCIFNDITSPIVIVDPAVIAPNIITHGIACNSVTLGSFDVDIDLASSGGVAPFTYKVYDNSLTEIGTYTTGIAAATFPHSFTGLDFGNYYIKIIDSKGCEFNSGKLKIAPTPYLNLTSNVATASCATGVTVVVNVTGGVGPYTYSVLGRPADTFGPTASLTHTFTGLDQGTTYQFEVVDVNGCPSYLEIPTPIISPIIINPIVSKNVTCYNANNGEVSFTVSNYSATKLYYELRDDLTNIAIAPPINNTVTGLTGTPYPGLITGLKPGNYTLYVKEMDGVTLCSTVASFQITQPTQALASNITSVVNANCNTGAQVTLTTTGGTGPYEYAIALFPAVPSSFLPTNTNVLNLDFTLGNKWNIMVRDKNLCTVPLTTTIFKDPTPVIALKIVDKCVAEGAFAINVTETTAGVGAYSISVNGSAFNSIPGLPYTVTGLNSGLNKIIIKDANGCTDAQSITIDKPLEMTPAITSPSCNNVITLTGTGGTGSYTYSISPMPLGVTIAGNVISDVPAGVYIVTMTDTATPSACSITASVTLTTPTPVTFNAVTTPVSCIGSSDGIITVNLPATNDNPVYTYTISPVPPGSVQVDNVFSKLPAGTYTITVTSGKGCSLSDTNVIVGTPLALLATAAITDYGCNATNIPQPAKVTVNVTAGTGTGPYKYNFDGSTNYYDTNELYVVDNGSPQTVHFYVKDANGCLFDDQVIVSPYKKITDITFVGSAPTCPTPTSDVKLTVVGGYAIAKYEILSPAALNNGVSDTFSSLAPDTTYLFKVTDVNGCSFQKSFTTSKLTPIAIVGELVNDISCNVANGTTNNGTAKYTVTGFSASGNYTVVTSPVVPAAQITNVGDVITLSGLSAGSYKVTVTDITTGCTQNATVVITNPVAITFTAVSTKVYCSKDVSEITVSGVSGGTGAYTYAIVKAAASAPAAGVYTSSNILTVDTNLVDLSWDVYVKDANGCVAKITTPVVYNLPPTIIVPTQQCFTGTNLTVNLSGWTNVYGGVKSYTLDGSDLASSIATFTAPGTYKLGIKDDNGCEAFVNYTIQKQLLAVATITKGLYCAAPINATIKVDITDGVGPYSYQMYLGGAAVGGLTAVGGSSFTVSVATAGDYTFEITDSNSPACNVTTTKVTVNPPVPTVIVSTPITQAILCKGGTATMQVNIDGSIGLSPYTYSVTRTLPTALPTVTQLSNNVFTGLTAGTYDITVTDAKGCASATTSMVIGEPVVLTATHSYPANTTCSIATVITVIGHDGTPTGSGTGYYYNFNNEGYTTVNTYTVNDNGAIQNISYTVKDANGCETAPQNVTVNPLSKPTDLTFNASPIYCVAPNLTSTVDVTANKGVGTLTFKIIGTNTATAPALWGPITTAGFATPASFSGLLPGDYTFQVTDSNGCSYEELYTVKDVVKITANGQLVAGVACKGDANGKVTFTVSGFSAGGFTKTITGVSGAGVITPVGTDTFELTNLVTGNYKIDVTDNTTGCVSTFTVFVPEPVALGVSYVTVKNANCKVGTTIKATANDGTADYTYAFVKAGDPKVYSNSDTAILDPAFTWVVWAKDAHNCEVSAPITIITDPMPTVTATVASQCANPAGYTINVVGTGVGTLEYSLDGNSFQTATSFIVSSPGSYTVTVRDGNKCTASAILPVIILNPLALKGDVTKFRSCGAVNDGEITLTATGGSGIPNYEYSNGAGAYGASNVFSGLAAGTYTMNVRDKITLLCVKSIQVTIDAPTLVTGMALSKVDVSCKGSSDGSITVALDATTLTVNNNPDYNFSLTGTTVNLVAVTRGNQLSNVFGNLEAGTYTVTTTSSRGCQDTKTITIVEPGSIAVPAPVVVEYACSTATPSNAMNLATITVNGTSGGSGTYTTYEFIKLGTIVQSGKSNVYTQTDLSGGTFTINVYDDKHCVGTTVATIKPFVSIDFAATAINVTKAITCVNDEEIRVNVTLTGTTVPMPTLIYNVKGLSAGSIYNVTDPVPTGVFKGLTVGDYMVTVTNPDTGCAIQTIHYINEPNTFDLQVKSKSDVVCFGSNEGSVELFFVDSSPLPTDESGPYSYIIKDAAGVIVKTGNSTNATPKVITGLKAGIYSVTATLTSLTSPQCTTAVKNFTISGPAAALAISETHTRITCASNTNGTISATAEGGWQGGYMYQLELGGAVIKGWSTVSDFSGLGAGNYTVRVKDSKGCEATVAVPLSIPTPIAFVATPSTALLTCFGDNSASISVSAPTGGQGSNYLYTLNTTSVTPNTFSGPQASPVFANLGAGTYTVTVTDGFSCSTTSAPIVIAQPTIVKASLVVSSTQTCTVLTSLTLSAIGGTGLYSYSTTPNFAITLGSFASSVTFPVAIGTYHYYVKDANGCVSIVSNDVTIDPLVPLTIKLDVTNAVINCRGDNTGVIVATANGGLGNYVYTLLDDATNNPIAGAVQTSPGYFTKLAAGSYKVRVVSRDCNTVTATITITQPNLPLIAPFTTTPVTCNGDGDGKVVINASGGTGVIKYAISPDLDQFFESNTFNKLKPKNYDVIVQDVLGCYVPLNFTITEPNAIDVRTVANSIIPEICVGDKNGAFKINVTGGVAPYTVDLDKPNAGNTTKGIIGQTQFDFSNGITGGDHMVYITDMNGCTAEWKVSLPRAINLDPKAVVTYECDVNTPGNKVTVTVDPSNTVASDIDYTIDGVKPFQASNVFANVAPGLHYVEARHTNGCIQKFNGIAVDKLDPLSLSLDLGGLNEIVATISGGSGIYQVTVNGEPMTAQNKFIYFKSGNYTVVLTDSNGCTVSATKYFEFIDIIIPPIFTPTGDNTNETWRPTNTENYPDIKFIVYDRYGREVGVFGAGESWDGKYKGTELPMGDYWYVLKLKHSQDDREFIGHFTLYR